MEAGWAAVLAVPVILSISFAIVEYRGLTDGKIGGTVSEWTNSNIPASVIWIVLPAVLLGVGIALAWHFTYGKGRDWLPKRKEE